MEGIAILTTPRRRTPSPTFQFLRPAPKRSRTPSSLPRLPSLPAASRPPIRTPSSAPPVRRYKNHRKIASTNSSAPDRFIPRSAAAGVLRVGGSLPRSPINSADSVRMRRLGSPGSPMSDEEEHSGRLAAALGINTNPSTRILNFTPILPTPPKPTKKNPRRVSASTMGALRLAVRAGISPRKPHSISTRLPNPSPVRILDAPGLSDDFYRTLLGWSKSGHLIVGLDSDVYLWHESTRPKLMELEGEGEGEEKVCAVAFATGLDAVAIARDDGTISICAVNGEGGVRVRFRVQGGIGAIAWRCRPALSSQPGMMGMEDLVVGGTEGQLSWYAVTFDPGAGVHGYELREVIRGPHDDQICGVVFSEDGLRLLVGGNDNRVTYWDFTTSSSPSPSPSPLSPSRGSQGREPKWVWEHGSAVKALAFCPWKRSLVATGGGSHDKKIRFFHTFTGAVISEINVEAQVTGLCFSRTRKEICATFGYAAPTQRTRIAIFEYPSGECVFEVPVDYEMRCLGACLSPGGGRVVVAQSDETIRCGLSPWL
ncbi:WD40 repeat-like protein [Saitoella complicata NRRL Y-17804]|uniref:WD40 repeat-like protein n=1 Tax=Saitoella complicata (strain BCRC 22490 / CBS 7301 / JCM 7358 / NBRC 10748 / NRRL Y-17804) TaxID=698492 RepID=UPI000867FBDD|nr:WD40 repeat-like protein [Saitoella complicata NRRL Y-17804]ODQ55763.1 WD40 repeat-like protein [Saitoella complicata NRRL Y-17804]